MFLIRIACCAVSFFLASSTIFAEQASTAAKSAYPDTPEGLRKLMGDILITAKNHSPKESALISSLVLPDDASWFAEVFGRENGAKLSTSYKLSVREFHQYAEGLFAFCAREDIDKIEIEPMADSTRSSFTQTVVVSMVHPVSFYRVSFRKGNKELATSRNYVYAQEGFRYISDDVFMSLPGMPTGRIRIAENAWLPKGPRVKPVPPTDATGKPIHGKVLLLVVIDVKGNVRQVTVEKGDAALGQAAADAVRQWHFEPFIVTGNAIEVETNISVKVP